MFAPSFRSIIAHRHTEKKQIQFDPFLFQSLKAVVPDVVNISFGNND
jgi:hypothetical protein